MPAHTRMSLPWLRYGTMAPAASAGGSASGSSWCRRGRLRCMDDGSSSAGSCWWGASSSCCLGCCAGMSGGGGVPRLSLLPEPHSWPSCCMYHSGPTASGARAGLWLFRRRCLGKNAEK